mgnify:CR=1 FL=1
MNLLHIFRTGKHIATNGTSYDFSDAVLAAIAAAYDPAKHEAPLVVGHPKHDDPAYGWVKALSFADGNLQAEPAQVDPQFAEMVGASRFKKISASFYPPAHASNPTPGSWYLRHVGFLGAMPPAVKGLKSASFNEAEEGTVEFGDWADMQNASLWRGMRDWIISKFGLDEADKVLPDYAVTSLTEEAVRQPEVVQTATPSYSEPAAAAATTAGEEMSTADKARLAALETENAALKSVQVQFAEREAAVATREAAARAAEIAEFVEGLATSGKILPKDKPGLAAYLTGPSASGVIEFGEGDAKITQPANEWLRNFLTALPKQVEFSEVAGSKHAVTGGDGSADEIAKQAVEFQETEAKAGRSVSAAAAVKHVTAHQ